MGMTSNYQVITLSSNPLPMTAEMPIIIVENEWFQGFRAGVALCLPFAEANF